MRISCPSCEQENVILVGTIPSVDNFAREKREDLLPGGSLYKCLTCYLAFRFPKLPKEKLDELYRIGYQDETSSPQFRLDWEIARNWILSNTSNGKVLDVGCFDGGFLYMLPKTVDKFGLEINKPAAERAKKKGVQIIGDDLDGVSSLGRLFDVVVAIDFIDHVDNPRGFLESLVSITKQGGAVIISTGNVDSCSWRIMGSRYWYCSIAEHISFISPQWCRTVASRLSIKIVFESFFSHVGNPSYKLRLTEAIKNIFYRISPSMAALLRKRGFGRDVSSHQELALSPPTWITSKDHFITVFRKP